MAQHALHGFHVGAGAHGKARSGVPQVMRSKSFDPGPRQRVEKPRRGAGTCLRSAKELPEAIGEDEIIGRLALTELGQGLAQNVWKRDRALLPNAIRSKPGGRSSSVVWKWMPLRRGERPRRD